MFPVEPSTTGVAPVLMILILIFLRLGFAFRGICRQTLFMISMVLVVTLLSRSPMPLASSAALPACLDGFIVETNGSTGEAYTCTSLHL